MRGPRKFAWTALAALTCLPFLTACKKPPEPRFQFEPALRDQGRAVIERVGCAACHAIPGFDWPEGAVGPSLADFDDRGPIAGELPNDPDNLALFVRNAPAAKPGSAMPAMPITAAEARAVAAYLYGMNGGD